MGACFSSNSGSSRAPDGIDGGSAAGEQPKISQANASNAGTEDIMISQPPQEVPPHSMVPPPTPASPRQSGPPQQQLGAMAGRPPALLPSSMHGGMGTSPRSPSPLSASSIHIDAAVLAGGSGRGAVASPYGRQQSHQLGGRAASGGLLAAVDSGNDFRPVSPGPPSTQTSR